MKNNTIDNLSLFLQALSLQILFQDYNNSDLMGELKIQDEMFFKTIIKNQEKILKLLEERSDAWWKKKWLKKLMRK